MKAGPVHVRFFVDERNADGSPSIRLTDDRLRLTASVQGGALSAEAESRRRLVEMLMSLKDNKT